MSLILCVTIALSIAVPSLSDSWDYGSEGPQTWGEHYPDCDKKSQSPINIITDNTEIDYDLPTVDRRIFFSPPTEMTIVNNGHSLEASFVEGAYEISEPKLLPFTAKIAQYHFHWGKTPKSGGSEHTLNGKQYFGELHAVHYNTKYPNISVAIDKPDGLAVFGWFIDVDYPQKNADIERFLKIAASRASEEDDVAIVKNTFSLETLLPADLDRYFRYKGSLTTPGCYESVLWTVFEDPIRISLEQAAVLSDSFTDTDNDVIHGNFRPVQPLNGRTVTRPPRLVPESETDIIAATFYSDLQAKLSEIFAIFDESVKKG